MKWTEISGVIKAFSLGVLVLLTIVVMESLLSRGTFMRTAGHTAMDVIVSLFPFVAIASGYLLAARWSRKNTPSRSIFKHLLLTLLWFLAGMISVGIFVPVR